MADRKPKAKTEAKKKPGPVPMEFTKEQVAQIEALASVLTQAQIGDYLGISERTLRDRISKDEAISAAYARGRARAIAGVGKNLLQQANDGNVNAIKFYLETQAGWKVTQVQEHAGRDGAPLEIVVKRTVIKSDADR
jgi:hypothetical protein